MKRNMTSGEMTISVAGLAIHMSLALGGEERTAVLSAEQARVVARSLLEAAASVEAVGQVHGHA